MLLSVECGVLEVSLKKLLINHAQTETRIISARRFGKRDVFAD